MAAVIMTLKNGVPTISIEGVCGAGCTEIARPFEQALGEVVKEEPTAEYYQTETQEVIQ